MQTNRENTFENLVCFTALFPNAYLQQICLTLLPIESYYQPPYMPPIYDP